MDRGRAALTGVSPSTDPETNLLFNSRRWWSPCYEIPVTGRLVRRNASRSASLSDAEPVFRRHALVSQLQSSPGAVGIPSFFHRHGGRSEERRVGKECRSRW